MNFVTNTQTRRGKRSRTHGFTPQQAHAVVKDITLKDEVSLSEGFSRVSSNITPLSNTVLGSHTSKGLTIMGSSMMHDPYYGKNPDERVDVPMGTSGTLGGVQNGEPNNNLAKPIFPITYNGPGHMKFMNMIELPHIRGDSDFKGKLNIHGGLTVNGVTLPVDTTPTEPFVNLRIEDSLGFQPPQTQTSRYLDYGHFGYITGSFEVTDISGMSGTLRIGGWHPSVLIGSAVSLDSFENMWVSSIGSNIGITQDTGSLSRLLIQEIYNTTGGSRTSLPVSNVSAGFTVQISAWFPK